MENKVTWLKKKLQIKLKTNIPKYRKKCVVIFVVSVLSISKKLLNTVRNKIKKESWQLIKKQKSYSKSKNVKKMPKKVNTFSLKIHKGAGIFKNLQKLSK